MKLSIASVSVVAVLAACAGSKATDSASQADFKADLQLASSTSMDLATPKVDPALLTSLETKPKTTPQVTKVVKKGAGPRAVRSQSPTVRAAPETDVAALDDATDLVTEAPMPKADEPVAIAPRPMPGPEQAGSGGGDYGTSGNGGGIFGPGGGIGGVVIRGGGVDGDHCEIHGTGRGSTVRRPVYLPPPIYSGGGMGGGSIGMGSRRGGMGGGSVSRPQGGGSSGIGMRRGR